MHKKFSTISLAVFLTAAPAFAQFEGLLEMKMTMTDPSGNTQGGHTIKVAIGKPGLRSEMNMQMPQMTMKVVMLQKADNPDVTYRINDDNKTYTEINLAKSREIPGQTHDTTQYTVEKVGKERILGYDTQHVLVKQTDPTTQQTSTIEMWLAKDFGDYGRFSRLSARPGARRAGEEGIAKALKDAGVEGMPLKSVTTAGSGTQVTMEVVKADKQSLPASTFEIPAGYTKSSGGMTDIMGGMSGPQADEIRKRMQDAMKNMTPEQREMMEKAMKQRQGGAPAGAP